MRKTIARLFALFLLPLCASAGTIIYQPGAGAELWDFTVSASGVFTGVGSATVNGHTVPAMFGINNGGFTVTPLGMLNGGNTGTAYRISPNGQYASALTNGGSTLYTNETPTSVFGLLINFGRMAPQAVFLSVATSAESSGCEEVVA